MWLEHMSSGGSGRMCEVQEAVGGQTLHGGHVGLCADVH